MSRNDSLAFSGSFRVTNESLEWVTCPRSAPPLGCRMLSRAQICHVSPRRKWQRTETVSGEKENCDVGRLSTWNGIICLRKPLCGDGEELHPLLWRPSVCWDNDIKDSLLCCLRRRVKPLKFGVKLEPHVQEKKLFRFGERGHVESAVLLCVQLWSSSHCQIVWMFCLYRVFFFFFKISTAVLWILIKRLLCVLYIGWTEHFFGCWSQQCKFSTKSRLLLLFIGFLISVAMRF